MSLQNINKSKKIFLIGIGGCGVSAVGKILHQMGYDVSGSDSKESSNTIRMRDLGVKVYIQHEASHLRDIDLVVYSSAISKDNVEYKEAVARDIQIIKRAEMLSWIMDHFGKRIAVAGTHGKTTTTSMIAKILADGDLDPTYMIGGEANNVDGNARLGKGPYAVAEADESDGSFLELSPNISVVTNIEPDHMEYFGTIEKLNAVFDSFIDKTAKEGTLIIGIDSPQTYEIAKKTTLKTITYGINKESDFQPKNISFNSAGSKFEVFYKGKNIGEVALTVPGEQNIVNSLAAIIVGLEAGLSFQNIASYLFSFSGAKRRFQVVGDVGGVQIIDDYAHHPTEIKATLKAAKLCYGEDHRIIAVFQPHRYTRTLALANDFGEAFNDADLIFLTDVYSAGEAPIKNVNGRLIANEVEKHKDVIYVPRKEKIPDMMVKNLKKNDMVIIMGAGDINTIAKEIISRLKIRG